MTKNAPSLQKKLGHTFVWLTLLFAVCAAVFSFWEAYHETHEFQDDLLKQIAKNQDVDYQSDDDDDDDEIQIRTYSRNSKNANPFNVQNLSDGFHTIFHNHQSFRVYVRDTTKGRVVVWQSNENRNERILQAVINSAVPLLLLIPLFYLLIWWIVKRTFLPISRLSGSLKTRQNTDLTPIATQNVPVEIAGFVDAINAMLLKIDQAMQQQQRFIADAAHELRTPLTALSLQAERLNYADLSPELTQQIQELQNGIRRNRQLLEQLLQHARAQIHENHTLHDLNAHDVFRAVIQDVFVLADEKQHDLGISGSQNPRFRMNETDAHTLIKTLCDNAINYTPNGGQINLSAHETAQHIVLQVEDNGKGIPIAERERVLEPFYRILGNAVDGSGLGLSIAQTIVQRYGGQLVLGDSSSFETGLLVSVQLPKSEINS